ncbi:MAG: hypothetical protein GXP49_10900 [Deltaproteobacteria bacterium]|nr:hypothetical protein [Deltaproteobacteria bacterium]
MARFLVMDRRGGSPDLIQLYKGEHEVHSYSDFDSALDFVHEKGGYDIGIHYYYTNVKKLRLGVSLDSYWNTFSFISKVRKDWKPGKGPVPLELIILPGAGALYVKKSAELQRDHLLAEMFMDKVKSVRMRGTLFCEMLKFETNLDLGLKLLSNRARWSNEIGRVITENQALRLAAGK